jgi:hypothetical protein
VGVDVFAAALAVEVEDATAGGDDVMTLVPCEGEGEEDEGALGRDGSDGLGGLAGASEEEVLELLGRGVADVLDVGWPLSLPEEASRRLHAPPPAGRAGWDGRAATDAPFSGVEPRCMIIIERRPLLQRAHDDRPA